MAEDILNRVSNSQLVTFDLEDYYPQGERVVFDIKDWLLEGIVLREKDFRASIKSHDWSSYANKYVALTCSTDAIIPGWAYLLVSTHLNPVAKKVVVGNLEMLETVLYTEVLQDLDVSEFEGKPVILKGCSRRPVPQNAYIRAINKLQPVARRIMYGEACSSVPLYKK